MVGLAGLGQAPPCALRDISSKAFFVCLFCVGVFFLISLFIYFFGCARSSLLHMGSSLVARWRLFRGFSCCRVTGSTGVASVAAVPRLPSRSTQPQLLHSTWDLPRSHVSPALVGGFFTTEPPGKSKDLVWPKVLLSF